LLADREQRAVVVASVAKLPPSVRDVIALKFWAGMSQVEIARALPASEATVSRRWETGAAELRGYLLEALGDDDRRSSEGDRPDG
jgi:RNA polymerase sigma factor (sigma-70 family)